jgi:hypothetical protein
MTLNHEFTPEERLRGSRTPSIYKSMAGTLKKRKKCNTRCFYFDTCPLMPMSMSSPEKKCMMKQFPERVRQRFNKVFLGGEEGLLNEINTAIYMYGLSADAAPGLKDKKDYIDLLLRLHKATYGDKSQIVGQREDLSINIKMIEAVNPVQKQVKEIPDGTVNVEFTPVLDEKPVTESKRSVEYKEKLKEEIFPVVECEMDPESLFTSEKLDEIIKKKEKPEEKYGDPESK